MPRKALAKAMPAKVAALCICLLYTSGKTTVKTLRYYDAIGLRRPKQIDTENGYRWYSTDQLIALVQIQQWRQLGLSVDTIGRIPVSYTHLIPLTKPDLPLRS